jgi:hypothetical protein
MVFVNVEILIHVCCFDTPDATAMFNPAPLALINNYTAHEGFCKRYGSEISVFSSK